MRNCDTRNLDIFTDDDGAGAFIDNDARRSFDLDFQIADFGKESCGLTASWQFQRNAVIVALLRQSRLVALTGEVIDRVGDMNRCRVIRVT